MPWLPWSVLLVSLTADFLFTGVRDFQGAAALLKNATDYVNQRAFNATTMYVETRLYCMHADTDTHHTHTTHTHHMHTLLTLAPLVLSLSTLPTLIASRSGESSILNCWG